MPRIQPLTCLLRPLAAPRTVTCRQHFRFSTAARLCDDKPATPSPPTASSQIPPALPTTPQSAARAAALAAAEATTESDSAQPPSPKPSLPSSQAAPTPKRNTSPQARRLAKKSHSPTPSTPRTQITLPYHVQRSATRNLPVYTDRKRGGNLLQTIVRKISGDASKLRDELREVLGKGEDEIKVVPLTGQVVIKGHCDGEVKAFLEGRGF